MGRHSGSDLNRHRSHVVEGMAYYSDHRMKFSSGNKRGDKFQPMPGYTGCIICKKTDCHSSRHSDEEQAASKAKYFAARKAEGVRATEKTFRSYLAYVEGIDPNSDQNRITSGHYLEGH